MTPDPWRFQRWAFGETTGSTGRKAVLSALAMMADASTGRCQVKQETLAQQTECEHRSVRRHLKHLEEQGLIERRRKHRKDGSRASDEFLLLAPWVTEWPDGQAASVSGRKTADLPDTDDPTYRTPDTPHERPLKNDHFKKKDNARGQLRIKGRPVKPARWSLTEAVLAEFNKQAKRHARALTGVGEPSEHAKRIYDRITEWPDLTLEDHSAVIRRTLKSHWWKGEPSIGVIYGKNIFETNCERKDTDRNGNGKNAVPLANHTKDMSIYDQGIIDVG